MAMTRELIDESLLESISSNAVLPKHVWSTITVVALSTLNRPKEIPKVLDYILKNAVEFGSERTNHDELLTIVRKMREGLIKSSAVAGMAKVINAIHALKSATPPELLDEHETNPTSRINDIEDGPPSSILARGQAFFDKTYGKVAEHIMSQADMSGCADLAPLFRLIYGYIVSEVSVLDPMETSFAIIAGLIPQDVNPQLIGHLHGAVNNGASKEQVAAVREIVIRICEASGMNRLETEEGHGGWGWTEEVASL